MKKQKILSLLIMITLIIGLANTASAVQLGVDLGNAGNFTILSKSGISTTGTTAIIGDIGVSPIAALRSQDLD